MSSTTKEYRGLIIKGPLSVIPVNPQAVKWADALMVYILMGPTGSGKSAFIQSLSPDQDLHISKDSLDSVTQTVTCYEVNNLGGKDYIARYILMDTPGLLDTRLSESRITTMIAEELGNLRQSVLTFVHILYFQPITDIRFGGSKRDAVKLLKAFAEAFNVSTVHVVTTMWNHMPTPKQIGVANRRLNSLENEIFVRSDQVRLDISKFEISMDSALSILDNSYGWDYGKGDQRRNMGCQCQSLIRNNLLHRISNIQQQLLNLTEEKQLANTPGKEDRVLLKVILQEENTTLAAFEDFLDDLYDLDPDTYHSHFPDLPFPRPPRKIPLPTRFKRFTSNLSKVFKNKK